MEVQKLQGEVVGQEEEEGQRRGKEGARVLETAGRQGAAG